MKGQSEGIPSSIIERSFKGQEGGPGSGPVPTPCIHVLLLVLLLHEILWLG
jgi:hypothetical protein